MDPSKRWEECDPIGPTCQWEGPYKVVKKSTCHDTSLLIKKFEDKFYDEQTCKI